MTGVAVIPYCIRCKPIVKETGQTVVGASGEFGAFAHHAGHRGIGRKIMPRAAVRAKLTESPRIDCTNTRLVRCILIPLALKFGPL